MKRKYKFKNVLMRLRKMFPGISLTTAACSAPVTPPSAGCLYPLNDLGAFATAIGQTPLVMNAPLYQSFSYTGVSVPPGGITLAASRDNVFSYAAGIALETNVNTIFELQMTQNTNYTSFFSLLIVKMNASNTVTGNVRLGVVGADGAVIPMTQLNGGAYSPDLEGEIEGPILSQSILVYISGNTGTLGWSVGGMDQGTFPGFVVGPTEHYTVAMLVDQSADVVAGSTISGLLATSVGTIIDRAGIIPATVGVTCKTICGDTF